MPKLKEKPTPVDSSDLGRKGSNTRGRLLSFVERFERLQEERDALGDDQKEIMEEAKSEGFDTKTMRKAIARRKMDSAAREEGDMLLETYEGAIQEAEADQVSKSVKEGGDPKPKAPGWGKKVAEAKAAEPVQIDVEDIAPSENEVNEQAARDIGRAADGKGDEIPSFLRRAK
jgi:uncharacterized protein (UPF0335 family)